jgi:catechol 2,3-dioxygenase-like lactoylglutathione lyase family enzyme
MPTISLDHLAIPVPEDRFEETIRFYEDVLGWREIREGAGRRFVFVADGAGGAFELLKIEAPGIVAPLHVAFGIPLEEFDGWHQRLVDYGVTFSQEVTSTTEGGRHCHFEDPAGNNCQLIGRIARLRSRWQSDPA